MYESKNNSSKQVLLSVLAVAILVVAVVGVSFAFFTYSKQGTKDNVINTGTLIFNYNETTNGISLTNAMPISDADAKSKLTNASDYFDFDVHATISGNISVEYEIVAVETTDPSANETLDSKYVKVMLKSGTVTETRDTIVKDATYFDDLTSSSAINSEKPSYVAKTLHTATIDGPDTSHFYRFYMWFSDKYKDGAGEKDTQMMNDVCTGDTEPVEGVCESGVKTKGTNGKTFTVKIAVQAKDKAKS